MTANAVAWGAFLVVWCAIWAVRAKGDSTAVLLAGAAATLTAVGTFVILTGQITP